MTRKQAKELIPIMQAFVEGKTIQLLSGNNIDWIDRENPNFEGNLTYRIKPEPKIVPFTFEDAKFLLGKKIFKNHVAGIIIAVQIGGISIGNGWCSFENLLNFKFEDEKICGKLVTTE